MPRPKKPSQVAPPQQQDQNCYEGERLARLLQSVQRAIESQKRLDGDSLPYNIWLKQQLAIGVNEVTRVLERMSPTSSQKQTITSHRLQAILVASDCNPKGLTKHLPTLAASLKVPVILVKDNKAGSLRLGQLVNLKTAIAIGVKAKGNAINHMIEEMLSDPLTEENESDMQKL